MRGSQSTEDINGMFPDQSTQAAEWYERGLALRKAGLFKQANEQFEQAAKDERYALRAYAQIGLCCKSSKQYDAAVIAFRNALKAPAASTKETVQLLYMLGRTLETLDRIGEALEVYRWLRREDSRFRDVAERIASLSTGRIQRDRQRNGRRQWTRQASAALKNLLWKAK